MTVEEDAKTVDLSQSRFFEILRLLQDPKVGSRYTVPYWGAKSYAIKPAKGARRTINPGDRDELGSKAALERIADLNPSSQNHCLAYYEGKRKDPAFPQLSFFVNLAELLLILDDEGNPLISQMTGEPIVFYGFKVDEYIVEPWMELMLLYCQDLPDASNWFSDFISAYYLRPGEPLSEKPASPLAGRVMAAMQENGAATIHDFAVHLYGSEKHPLIESAEDVLRKILGGFDVTFDDDSSGVLAVLAMHVRDDQNALFSYPHKMIEYAAKSERRRGKATKIVPLRKPESDGTG